MIVDVKLGEVENSITKCTYSTNSFVLVRVFFAVSILPCAVVDNVSQSSGSVLSSTLIMSM